MKILRASQRTSVGLMALSAFVIPMKATAFEFDTSPDWSVRFDNTVKASTKYRLRNADPRLSEAGNLNAGDQNFQDRGIVSERLDLLSEFDAVWRRDFGVRFSAAGWYDHKYQQNTNATDPSLALVGQNPINRFPDSTRTRSGRKAELLDAFIFGGVRLGEGSMKLTGRLGRHALQYGESLFFGDNGIARAQGPVDIDKLLASPGAQFKEIIRPVPQISTQLQVTQDVALGGYYQFRWEEDRLPAAGSYFSFANPVWGAPYNQIIPFGGLFILPPGADVKPKDSGQYGLQLKYRALETDFGAYYARYHDKSGQQYARLDVLSPVNAIGAQSGSWYYVYPEGVRTFGLSASRSWGEYNFAAEASIRHNMPLRNFGIIYPSVAPADPYAVGKTAHLNLSWFGALGPNLLAREATFLGEVAWNRVLSMSDPAGHLDRGRTRDATALRLQYSPTYRQVAPGLDVSVPFNLGYTLRGNSSVTAWGAEDTGDVGLGLEASYQTVWLVGLTYTKYIGKTVPFIDVATFAYGLGQPLKDRDFIALSVRRTF